MNRTETLHAALDAVDRRPKSYGPPEQNFDRIAARWNVHLENRYGDNPFGLDATDVAIMSIDLKLARLEESPDHEDSWVDAAGYAACGAEVSTTPDELEPRGSWVPFTYADFVAPAEAPDASHLGPIGEWVWLGGKKPFPSSLRFGDEVILGPAHTVANLVPPGVHMLALALPYGLESRGLEPCVHAYGFDIALSEMHDRALAYKRNS